MNEQLDDIRARRAAVTTPFLEGNPGRKMQHITQPYVTTVDDGYEVLAFLMAAPGDVDTLLAMVDALTGERDDYRAKFRDLEHELELERGQVVHVTAERDALREQLQQAQRELAAQNPDWTKAPNLAKWWAVDEDGTAHWYWTEPTMGKHGWFVRGNSAYCNVTSQSAGHVELIGRDWWDTLRQRPQN